MGSLNRKDFMYVRCERDMRSYSQEFSGKRLTACRGQQCQKIWAWKKKKFFWIEDKVPLLVWIYYYCKLKMGERKTKPKQRNKQTKTQQPNIFNLLLPIYTDWFTPPLSQEMLYTSMLCDLHFFVNFSFISVQLSQRITSLYAERCLYFCGH